MTEPEKRQQKMELLLEYQETEDELAHLKERAKKLSERIREVSDWLSDWGSYDKSTAQTERRHFQITTDPQFRTALSFDELGQLTDNIRSTQAKLAELQRRKQPLGLR